MLYSKEVTFYDDTTPGYNYISRVELPIWDP